MIIGSFHTLESTNTTLLFYDLDVVARSLSFFTTTTTTLTTTLRCRLQFCVFVGLIWFNFCVKNTASCLWCGIPWEWVLYQASQLGGAKWSCFCAVQWSVWEAGREGQRVFWREKLSLFIQQREGLWDYYFMLLLPKSNFRNNVWRLPSFVLWGILLTTMWLFFIINLKLWMSSFPPS